MSGARSSRLRDRKKEEREVLVKKAFLDDMMNESNLLFALLAKATTSSSVLWEPDLLPSTCLGAHAHPSSLSPASHGPTSDGLHGGRMERQTRGKDSFGCEGHACCTQDAHESTADFTSRSSHCALLTNANENAYLADCMNTQLEAPDNTDGDEVDLPFGLNVDSGSLACVACGILGYPFMAILQPSEKASGKIFALNYEESHLRCDISQNLNQPSCWPCTVKKLDSENCAGVEEQRNSDSSSNSPTENTANVLLVENLSDVKESSSYTTPDMIDDEVDRSRSNHLNGPEKLSVASLLPVCSVSNVEGRQIPSIVEHEVHKLRPHDKNDDHLNRQHSGDETKEPGKCISMKNSEESNNKLCQADFPGAVSFNESDKLIGLSEKKSSDKIANWNKSNGFLRPRIFCLQHALEVHNLLRCKGGARVLVICHSDYLKIKALAISIAEEINIQFDCEDVPLVNASPSDLDLINVSIDDEGHEEDGNDWTSKLGLNLKYCVKLKKQAPSTQEHLTLSLGGIFSDPSPISVVSNLKWLSRKSRTPYKVVGVIQSKSQFDANNEKCELLDINTKSKTDAAKVTKVYHSLKLEQNDMASKHHGLLEKGTSKELGSGNESVKVDANGDERHKYDPANKVISPVKDDTGDNLHTVPILIAEYPQMHQVNWVTLRVSTCSEVVSSVKSDHLPVCQRSDVGYSEGLQEIRSDESSCKEAVCDPIKSSGNQTFERLEMSQGVEEAYRSKGKFDNFDKSEFPADLLTLVGDTSEALEQVSVNDKANLEDKFDVNREPASKPGIRPLHDSDNLENLEDSCRRSLLLEDQLLHPSESPVHSEIQLNNLSAQECLVKSTAANPAELTRTPDINIANGNNVQQEFLARTEHIVVGANISENVNQIAIDNLVVNNSEIVLEAHCADVLIVDTKGGDSVKVDVKTAFDSSMKLSETLAISVVERSITQEVDENTGEVGVSADNSSLLNCMQSNNGIPARVDLIHYVRRGKKRNREQEQRTVCEDNSACFVRSPCEGLRPRTRLKTDANAGTFALEKSSAMKAGRRPGNLVVQREDKSKAFKCDMEGCFMSFSTKGELSLHKRNRCTIEGCGKRFSSHKYAVRHQCVHNDDRPLECPWKGCKMTFKWAWARTEHVRVHTGERPYECKFSGCGQTFRFVSDFSRHRRKTGHYATPSAG